MVTYIVYRMGQDFLDSQSVIDIKITILDVYAHLLIRQKIVLALT